jgi:predicted nucleotidyltransferase
MARRLTNENDRARQLVAQEAARIIVEQGIEDYRLAKTKAAQRLGMNAGGSLPGNSEIEKAVSEYLQLFGRESHLHLLHALRQTALAAMELLSPFEPRLVGSVLHGTAAANSPVNLHVFADSAEMIVMRLDEQRVSYRPFERRLKCRRDKTDLFGGFRFMQDDTRVEATVFPIDGVRQAPISPVDGKPMRRVDKNALLELLRSEMKIPL